MLKPSVRAALQSARSKINMASNSNPSSRVNSSNSRHRASSTGSGAQKIKIKNLSQKSLLLLKNKNKESDAHHDNQEKIAQNLIRNLQEQKANRNLAQNTKSARNHASINRQNEPITVKSKSFVYGGQQKVPKR